MALPPGIPADVPGLWERDAAWLLARGVASPRVAIHGGYGKNNLGDDAILDVLVARTLTHFPAAELRIVCHGPENVRRRYREVANLTACHFRSREALRAVATSHLYIIGGGGIVNRINAYSGRHRLRLLDMKGKYLFVAALGAKLCGARTHFYAIGVNSFPDAGVRLLAKWGLRYADDVSVRDRMSLDTLRALGVRRNVPLVLDPAVSLAPAPAEEGERLLARWGAGADRGPRACIGFRYVRERGVSNAAKVGRVAALARHLIAGGFHVVFLAASQHPSQHYEDDLHFGRAVRDLMGADPHFTLIEEYAHPRVTMAALGRMDFCVLERLHAVILASVAGAPVHAIAYDDKVAEFVRLVGREAYLTDLRSFLEPGPFDWLDAHLQLVRAAREAS